jgi:hypothetical protein
MTFSVFFFFLMEGFTWVKYLILLSISLPYKIGREIRMKTLLFLRSWKFNFTWVTFQFDLNIFQIFSVNFGITMRK